MISTKPCKFIFYFSFLAILLFFVSSLTPAFAVSKLIHEVCEKTGNYNDCVAALDLDPKAESASNFLDLAKIELNLAIVNSSMTLVYINHILEMIPTEPYQSCQSAYIALIGSFKSSLNELDGDAETANYDAWIASDIAEECESALAYVGVKDETISTGNGYVKLYSNIAYWITYDL